MASYSEKDIDTEEDEQWKPPTEAEMKVIEARRERSDRISKIMGSYLLKGYKMLATECTKCGTINLQDKDGKLYCVACEEVDPEIKKDNPALNEEAASSKRAEQQFATGRNRSEETQDVEYNTACSVFASKFSSLLAEPSTASTPQGRNPPKRTLASTQAIAKHTQTASSTSSSSPMNEEYARCLETVNKKLRWATESLDAETDTERIVLLLKVITHSVEAVAALRRIVQ